MSDSARVVVYRRLDNGAWKFNQEFHYVDHDGWDDPRYRMDQAVRRYLHVVKARHKAPHAIFQFPPGIFPRRTL